MKLLAPFVGLGLFAVVIIWGWILAYQSKLHIWLQATTFKPPKYRDLIGALKALQSDFQQSLVQLSAHHDKHKKYRFAEISLIHCQLAANISAMMGNTGVLCQKRENSKWQ